MNKWEMIDTTAIPNGGGELRLFKRDLPQRDSSQGKKEFAIRITGTQGDLMNSRTHGSEDALGMLACEPFARKSKAKILVGGLGMGFTLATSLQALGPDASITVAELVPGVVKWNKEVIGECAGQPLTDSRVHVVDTDVGVLIDQATQDYDSILLDVDNGPEGLTHVQNDNLYSEEGLQAAYAALKPQGMLAVWSVAPSKKFAASLSRVGFNVDEKRVRAHQGKGATHIIWLARRTDKRRS